MHNAIRTISKLMATHTDDWEEYLDTAVFATNTSIQCSSKFTPFKLMYGRDPRFPLEAEKIGENMDSEDILAINSSCEIEDLVAKMTAKQKSIFEVASENIKKAQEKQIEQYRKRKGIISHHIKIGDNVLRRNMKQKTRKGSKDEDRWLGPFEVVQISKTTCVLKNKEGKQLKTRVNINQLKPYLENDKQSNNFTSKSNDSPSDIYLNIPESNTDKQDSVAGVFSTDNPVQVWTTFSKCH